MNNFNKLCNEFGLKIFEDLNFLEFYQKYKNKK
jgi:hypothetical protein